MRLAPQEIRTFFVTSVANNRHPVFRADDMARLLIDVMQENRKQARFQLHEVVVMPDHFHLILTPAANVSLEKGLQYIKGRFSFRAKKELGYRFLIWQEGFTNHRIRDADDYLRHRDYVWQNPVKRGLVSVATDYRYSSAFPGAEVDPAPPGLKPAFRR